jgi:hypothetical protein
VKAAFCAVNSRRRRPSFVSFGSGGSASVTDQMISATARPLLENARSAGTVDV